MSRETICPGLYKDEKGKFYCKYADNVEVDPAFMSCLLEYWECPSYIRHKQAEKRVEAEKKEEIIAQETRPRVEVVEAPTVVIPLVEAPPESFMVEVDRLIERASQLTKLWESYEESARVIIDEWEELRDRMKKELAGLEAVINTYVEEGNRLEKLYTDGKIGKEEYSDLKSRIEKKLAEKSSEKETLTKKLAELDRVILPHYKRVKVAEVKPEIAKLKLALVKLEEKYKSKSISEEVYRRLKAELEDKIQRLEKIKEEVE